VRVGILGGSGLVGSHLAGALRDRGVEVSTASLRQPDVAAAALCTCDVVVNLAGEPIAQRWTKDAKARMVASRIDAPRAFLQHLMRSPHKPSAYISASAIGYYEPSETATYTESAMPGSDFLGRLCSEWEREAQRAAELGMRVAIVRTGVVLAIDGGALAKMLPAFRLGLGGVIGTGKQWISWVHIDDVVSIYRLAIDGAAGTFNATAPSPVTNADFTRVLAATLHRPSVAAMPTVALRLMLGEGADVLLTGQRVLPERTLAEGYRFAYTELGDALRNLLG
jgi:uncharacterized protein